MGEENCKSRCDLVMKGGITSGVIYPKLVSGLAEKYEFKNIGGTSAGAIAAGASAAAEYGRRNGNPNAFAKLDKLPGELSAKTGPSGRSKLFTLFQPAASVRSHFNVLVAALNKKPTVAIRDIVAGIVLMHPGLIAVSLLVGSLLLLPAVQGLTQVTTLMTWIAAGLAMAVVAGGAVVATRLPLTDGPLVLAGIAAALAVEFCCLFDLPWALRLFGFSLAIEVLAVVAAAVSVLFASFRFGASLAKGLHGNGYGLCSGQTDPGAPRGVDGLTNWLTEYLNELAGLAKNGTPLTFGHLWGTSDPKAPRNINLEVMTSAVSQQMVYSIPFRDGTPRFFYDPSVWANLFPPQILACLSKEQMESDELPAGAVVVDAAGRPLKPLPRGADLPVVVAIRMSLSFPVLLSAVPLHSIDWTLKKNQLVKSQHEKAVKAKGDQAVPTSYEAAKVWFSDGGIGSNLPLHMFDALLPGHPTFAVNLKPEHPDFEIPEKESAENEGGRVYLAEDNRGGLLRHTAPPDDSRPAGGLISFLISIINTMQNWRDEIMFPYPGFRDRLVQISQRTNEGGLNLDMPSESIQALSNAGEMAAQRLINRFHPMGLQMGAGWENHRTIRLRTFLGLMQPGNCALEPAISRGVWHSSLARVRYNKPERELARDFLDGLQQLAAMGAKGVSLDREPPKPVAQIRIVPRI